MLGGTSLGRHGVDFSHVGPRYGESQTPDEDFLKRVHNADHQLIEAISSVDASRFVEITTELNDRYRVCGFAPIHTLLATTSATSGQLLKYEQGKVDDQKSVVTFASAVLR